jgi:DNA polymerase elongation subunit (family B)
MEFQLYDWIEEDELIESNDDSDEDMKVGTYIIHSFGRCNTGESVYCKITDFTPYFYILLPHVLQNKQDKYLEYVLKNIESTLKGYNNRKVYYKYKNTLIKLELKKLKIAEGFTNNKELWFIRLVFNNYEGFKKYRYYLENTEISFNIAELNEPIKFKLYEANLPPMLRCFHIKNISGCSWVEVNKYKLIEQNKTSLCDIEIITKWTDLKPLKKEYNAPFRIASFDIECNSCDGGFPQAKRPEDYIIQIGVTYTYIGESVPYRQYIACLNNTSNVENAIVESCATERDLLKCFLEEINNNDCDIMTGYNIFFFDEKYIYDRCKEILQIDIELSYMSKLKNFKCKFKEMKLASSALGDNELKFWDTPGRVHVDLMKDIQKTFSLSCYKLDYVASNFIRGEIINFCIIDKLIELTTEVINDLYTNDYIHLEIVKGFISDNIGEKYKVININKENKIITIYGNKELILELQSHFLSKNNSSYIKPKLFWSQAKDDIEPKQIFKLFKGSADDRSIVAKYCIKDCNLVNLLLNKLEVITKNIEMANVCHVPLSYLFIRGQGIKLFSLCLKEYRIQNFAFPVIKVNKKFKCLNCNNIYSNSWECKKCNSRKKEELRIENDSYEGAIVFDPIPKVEYEACTTKDYASLYPSAIIQKNMSHETIVENQKYDNIPDIIYYNSQYKENDGSIKYCRYAKIDNKLGVIPTILDNLLNTRKNIKKLMKIEKDPFKLRILDAKQLAVKITANSLYGQLGASTSPICKRDIAACTTSTGREMLIYAKKYDEEILPWIINGLKYYYKTNDIEKVNIIYDLELKARNNEILINNIKKYVVEDIQDITFQPVIRYGDSVIGKTTILLKYNNFIYVDYIENVTNQYYNYDNKEIAIISNLYTWTEIGWTLINNIIRHKINKQLYKITTNDGEVVVTQDHSLLDENKYMIRPTEININTKLLHSYPIINNNLYYIDELYANYIGIILPIEYDIYMKILNSSLNVKKAFIKGYNNQKINNNIIKQYIYIINKSINQTFKENKIISIELYNKKELYVYDLSTDNHHFQAGYGSIIVHNTDSIFSCYRFRENTKIVKETKALLIWKKIIAFARTLIEPFLDENNKYNFNKIFDEYYCNINDLKLPILPAKLTQKDKIYNFIKEYMQENYLSWLWTIAELVEKNYIEMLDIKLLNWVEFLLTKHNIPCENIYINRKAYLIEPIVKYIKNLYNIKYINITDQELLNFINKFNKENESKFEFADEITLDLINISKLCKIFIYKTLKDKWIYSSEKTILNNITKKYILLLNDKIDNIDTIISFIINFIEDNNKLDINKLVELLINSLKNYIEIIIDNNLLLSNTKEFIEKYNKNKGKKQLEELVEDFLEKQLKININKTKIDYYNNVIKFVNTNLKYIDMTDMDKGEQSIYYWIQPRIEIISHTDVIIKYINRINKKYSYENIEQIKLLINNKDDIIEYIKNNMKSKLDENNINIEITKMINKYNKFKIDKVYRIDIYEGGDAITDKRTLNYSIELGKISGELIKQHLPFPHDLEYEKTYWPFAILTKKRYVGNKYEFDYNKYKLDFMGIVLKRRDNAPIVKEICGGIINYLINYKSPEKAKLFLKECLTNMFENKYDIKYFLQSKTLKMKESYKEWSKIAHVYLADKISKREIGNIPQSGDRLEYAIIKIPPTHNKIKILQGDIIETPKFIKENKLEIDYLFYLTNQIMNPVLQFLNLVDKTSIDICNEFIQKYSIPKIIKEKIIKKKKISYLKITKEDILKNNKFMIELKKINIEIHNFLRKLKQHK